MALTLTKVPDSEDVWGKHRVAMFDLVGDASYPAGGYAITPSQVGMRRIYGVKFVGGNPAAGRLIPHWDTSAGKYMLAYPTGGGIASPAALSDPILNAGAVAVTSSAATAPIIPGQGKELLAATNVSTITFRALF